MLLGRFRIRAKLALLVMIPLLAVCALTVPVVLERVGLAGRASDTARSVRLASEIGSLAQDLQRERLLAVGFLVDAVDRSRLVLQMSAVTDRITDVRHELDGDLPREVDDAIDAVRALADLRVGILDGTAPTDRVTADYGSVISRLIGSLRLVDGVDAATEEGRQVLALDALLRADEANSSGAAYLVLLSAEPAGPAAARFGAEQAVLAGELSRFTALATPTQIALYQLVADAFTSRLGGDFTAAPARAITGYPVAALFPSLESFIALGNFVEKRIVADVTAAVAARERRALTTAYGVGIGSLAVLVLVVLLVVAVARAVARPLTRLTVSADMVARVAEAELVRVADDEAESIERIHLDAVDVRARDEVGDLARAFERVQETAARLVERQVASRRNVAEMFGHIGRRTQALVGRQVALIDDLEHEETDTTRLQRLYRLDHLSNRLLRSASSLVVLSGADWADEHVTPLPLADAARLALAEIEDYTRVDVEIPPDIVLAPAVIADLVLVLAELMENATSFSPPHTRVSVVAAAGVHGVRLTVTDHGIGLSEERLAEENARLERRERIDLAPTQVLGLFVVGRLARRHGMVARLSATPGGGVTVVVELPVHLLVHTALTTSRSGTGTPVAALVGARGRAAVPTGPDESDVLHRLRTILADGTPSWNAFAVMATPAESSPATEPAPPPASPLTSPPASPVRPAEPVRAVTPAPAVPVVTFEPPRAGPSRPAPNGTTLNRRVPGATLPATLGTGTTAGRAGTASAPMSGLLTAYPEASPDDVRAIVELFETGVARALNDQREEL